jgi:DNA repair photolyase
MAESLISKPIPDSKYFFDRYISPNKRYAAEAMRPRIVDFELTSKCGGACTYCYASSPYFKGADMPTEQALALVDDLAATGVSQSIPNRNPTPTTSTTSRSAATTT